MIRALALAAALAAGMTLPALADDTASQTQYQQIFTETQARQHLMHQGYTDVSTLQQDESGKWVGTALKDGKKVVVAVDIKRPVGQSATN